VLITGAPDDDASGIAIYSQVEVQFDFSMGWVMLFTFPLLAAIQEINAGISRAMVAGDSFIPTLRLDKDHVVAIVAVPLMVMMLMAPKVTVCFTLPPGRCAWVGCARS
jgi:Mn2+/Fe2+ NRAMP family transporter